MNYDLEPARVGETGWSRIRGRLYSAQLFVRFSALGGTLILPLLGAATVSPPPGQRFILGMICLASAYHIFAYVLNDVIDLPLDRSEPRRAEFPLVRGTITPRQALMIAFLQIPLMLALTAWLGGGWLAYGTLMASPILMTIYNLWGKRAAFPPLTDLVQGLAWGSLALFGAALAAGRITPASAILCAYVIVFIVLANGVHGSLRDLANDLNHGVRSTAILMGAHPVGTQGVEIPGRLLRYAMVLNATLVSIALFPLVGNLYGYTQLPWAWATLAVIILSTVSFGVLRIAARSSTSRKELYPAGLLHLLLSLSTLIAVFAPAMDRTLLLAVMVVFALPLLTHSWLPDSLRWGIAQLATTKRPDGVRYPGPALPEVGALNASRSSKRWLDSLSGVLKLVHLGLRLLVATAYHRHRYPLTASALWAGLRSVPFRGRIHGFESHLVVTRDQIDNFLSSSWGYTERRLKLLRQVSRFPITQEGAKRLMELRQQMDSVRDAAFVQVAGAIYENPAYPIFQHVGQAFRNQVTGRGPFLMEVLAALPSPPQRVCDAGCGSGILLGDLLECFPQAEGTGIDISGIMLRHTQRVLTAWGLEGRFDLLNADLRSLPCRREYFDMVVAMEVLEHIPDPLIGMQELVRILTPGGCLVTSIPVQDQAPVHMHIFASIDEVIALHTSAGLVVQRQQVAEVAPDVPNVMLACRRL